MTQIYVDVKSIHEVRVNECSKKFVTWKRLKISFRKFLKLSFKKFSYNVAKFNFNHFKNKFQAPIKNSHGIENHKSQKKGLSKYHWNNFSISVVFSLSHLRNDKSLLAVLHVSVANFISPSPSPEREHKTLFPMIFH
jgi:hypothetical protein